MVITALIIPNTLFIHLVNLNVKAFSSSQGTFIIANHNWYWKYFKMLKNTSLYIYILSYQRNTVASQFLGKTSFL